MLLAREGVLSYQASGMCVYELIVRLSGNIFLGGTMLQATLQQIAHSECLWWQQGPKLGCSLSDIFDGLSALKPAQKHTVTWQQLQGRATNA